MPPESATPTDSAMSSDVAPESAKASPDSAAPRPDSVPATAETTPPSPKPAGTPSGQIPSGTALELAAATRICSTTSRPGDRVPATVVVPVTGTGGAVIPVGATATFEVTRLDPPAFIGLRADSLLLGGRSYPLRDAQVKVHQREFTAGAGQTGVGIGACIPAGGRITVTLRSPITLG